MNLNGILTLAVVVPFVGAFILPVIGRWSERLRNGLSLIFVLVSLVAAVALIPTVTAGRTLLVQWAGFNLFYADTLAVFMAFVSSLVGAIIVLYSFGYIRHYSWRNEYYFMVVLFLGSMMGIVFSRNLLILYLFWEITAIACWRLIGFFREKSYVLKADKAFLVTVFGALVMLLGFITIYHQTGSFDLGQIQETLQGQPISNLAVTLILFGILSKSATVPLHTWLPDAGVAPSPVTALLHAAVLVKIGVYVYARLFLASWTIEPVWHTIIPAIAAVSALVAAGAALLETDLKRLIAYSTISQIGFIFLGLAIGNEIGIAGGLLYILMHGIAKGGLFLCAGIIEQNTHTKDITKMGGLIATMPVTAVSFLLCAFSVMGIPPFGGFFSKYMVMTGAVTSGQIAIALTFLVGAFLTIIYLFRVFTLVFFGESKLAVRPLPAEGSPVMVFSVALLGALSILSGLFINFPSHFVQSAVQQIIWVQSAVNQILGFIP
ncbi:MAG: NADH-quinone oxidoreductase subunit L [Verrucomicrobia bacterium]|nr:NADH-quinone oxidoreductase subunit L [Verrucomicrobiota bacterium]MCG2680509.1 NADH-quinone oxidoreductase subunit L [Kiritimatiellia bacterium]MBU4248232.1 NADH-quinone oxidoreductase subunit L [Verrucomicrobiota bacterium]MBU4290435.1 NADH-quinone oxidoreductase subunit L [Verrucomicrobiota bacterium]MBU4430158.1 NADH-quinone oxidoreductase subunit L [Verrucomicrobiota bacterium]